MRLPIDKGAELHSEQLLQAIRDGKVDVMALLLDKGFDIEEKFDGQSYLITVAGYVEYGALKLLVEKGADIENRNQDGKTALMVVVESRKRFPENLKAYPYYAASMKGALVNSTSHDGFSPLLLALCDFGTQSNTKIPTVQSTGSVVVKHGDYLQRCAPLNFLEILSQHFGMIRLYIHSLLMFLLFFFPLCSKFCILFTYCRRFVMFLLLTFHLSAFLIEVAFR